MRVRLRIFVIAVFFLLPVLAIAAHIRGFQVHIGQYGLAVGSAEMLITDSPSARIWYPGFGTAGSQPIADYFWPRVTRAGAIVTVAVPWISMIALWGVATVIFWGLTNPRHQGPAFPLHGPAAPQEPGRS